MNTLLVTAFTIGALLPTLLALIVSWHDVVTRHTRLVQHAPRRRHTATILLYHTNTTATLRSLRHLRRIRAVALRVIVVVPADSICDMNQLRAALPTVLVHHKQRPASRQLTLASSYQLINPKKPLCIIDSGDILTASAIHTALRILRTEPRYTHLFIRQTAHHTASFLGVLLWFRASLRHSIWSIYSRGCRDLPSGTWLRSGTLLRSVDAAHTAYLPYITFRTTRSPELSPLSGVATCSAVLLLVIASICYVAGADLQTALPLITFWSITAWWLIILVSITPARINEKIIPLAVLPLAGILLPVWCTLLLAITLPRAWQRFIQTRHIYTGRSNLFRWRHP